MTGPDGISFILYHKFWDVIKGDICNMFMRSMPGEGALQETGAHSLDE
jgi:hypothetical protein